MTHREIPPEWQMKGLVQRYLATVPHKVGETVQLGWFVFRIADDSQPPEIESLDFCAMASFTRDFSAAERVRDQQWHTLCRCGATEEPCTLHQTALVSRSYSPQRPDVFLERQSAAQGTDAGWYVGVVDEELNLDDEQSFDVRSLYELSIADQRLVGYWLLPVGRKVIVASGDVYEITGPTRRQSQRSCLSRIVLTHAPRQPRSWLIFDVRQDRLVARTGRCELWSMPTVLRIGAYRFHFYSDEGSEPPHIHVRSPEGECKFWLDPISLASVQGIRPHDVRTIERLVFEHRSDLLSAYHDRHRNR